MYIVIIGGGRVGFYMTKALMEEGHEVLVVEKDATVYEAFVEQMGSICIRGDGCEAATLEEVGTGRADMLVAVTGDDEDNLVACQVAKHKFNVPRTIARLRNPRREKIFKILGVDVTVCSTKIILEAIQHEVPTHPLTHLMEMQDQGLEMVEIKIVPESASVGKSIGELELPAGCKIALIIPKSRRPIIPRSTTVMEVGDQVIALTPSESEEELRKVMLGA